MFVAMEERGPWRTISVEERYSTPWIAVSHHEVLDPSGKPGIYGVIHFKNLAVGIVPLDADLNTWIVGQYRYPLGLYSWEIPEGGGRRDLPPIESARRELREEVGLTAGRLERLGSFYNTPGFCDEHSHVFLATECSAVPDERQGVEEEAMTVVRLPLAEARQAVVGGRIVDGKTVIGLLLALPRLGH